MALFREGKLEIMLSVFNGSSGRNFHLWKIRVKAVLRGQDLIGAIDDKRIEHCVSMKPLSIIISGLGDNPSRPIQDCETAQSAWKRRHNRCTGRSIVNTLSALNNFLNC